MTLGKSAEFVNLLKYGSNANKIWKRRWNCGNYLARH